MGQVEKSRGKLHQAFPSCEVGLQQSIKIRVQTTCLLLTEEDVSE
jgi:hypothetical protein